MNNIVIYARYSSHQQTEQSIEGQLRDCYEYANKHNLNIVHEYIDRALSAKTDNRPQFLQMISDAEQGGFDTVLVWKLDRFARNRYDSAFYKSKLKKCGVSVTSVMENISSNAEGILLESLLEGFAEYFSVDLAEKVSRGMKESANKFKAIGPLPLGYLADENKNIIIDESTAPIVRTTFELFAQGYNSRYIADYLNSQGYRTRRGKPFRVESILDIIHNHRYLGIYDFYGVYEPNKIPQLVSKELYDKANENIRVNKRKRTKSDMKIDYLLSGRCKCGYCGMSLVGESGTTTNGTHYYYKCSTLKRKLGECEKKTIKKEYLENTIINSIKQDILNDDTIQCIVNMVLDIQKTRHSNTEEKVLLQEKKELEKVINNYIVAIGQGIPAQTIKKQLDEAQCRLEAVECRLKDFNIERHILNSQEIEAFLKGLKTANIDDIRIKRQLIASFVKEIKVYNEKIEIAYTLVEEGSTIPIWYSVGDKNRIYFDGKYLHHTILLD